MTRAFPRKDFLNLVGGTGLLTALGCAAEDPAPDPTGGAGGMAGGAGTSGSSGTAGGGTAGTTAGTGGSSGTAGTTAGSSGSAGKGGAGGTSGSAGQGGSAGSQAGAGSGGGGAGSGGASGGGQGGMAGNAGGGQGGAQGGMAGGAGTAGGGQAGAGGGGGDACSEEIEAAISMNHNHALSVPMADIMAGVAKIYDAQGTATHPHYVELTAEDFATLRAGGTVKKVSCSGGDHEYVLSCGTASEQPGNPMCMMSDMCGGTMSTLCPDP